MVGETDREAGKMSVHQVRPSELGEGRRGAAALLRLFLPSPAAGGGSTAREMVAEVRREEFSLVQHHLAMGEGLWASQGHAHALAPSPYLHGHQAHT